jgi:hypothetical protein
MLCTLAGAADWSERMTWTKTSDGSIVDQDGKIIFFSTRRFIHDICIGNCCFICGAKPEEKPFKRRARFPRMASSAVQFIRPRRHSPARYKRPSAQVKVLAPIA